MSVQKNVVQTDQQARDELEQFKQLVETYRICWEVWPEYLMVGEKRMQVGFELVLAGAHEEGTHPLPGCPRCLDIFQHLKRIANWIIPKVERESVYTIQTYDSSIHRAVQRKLRSEVSLSLKILHRMGFDKPVDACEVNCLNEMQSKLKKIGAQYQVWKQNRLRKTATE